MRDLTKKLFGSLLLLTLSGCGGASVLPDMDPPCAAKKPRTLESHGHERQDPWYWLRDDKREKPEMLEYLKAENAYFKAALAPVQDTVKTIFEELKSRLEKDDSSVPTEIDSYLYYSRYDGREYPLHCRKLAADGGKASDEEVILDINARAKGHDYYAVGALTVSTNEKLLAFAEDSVSRRVYTIRFTDLSTGKDLDDRLERGSGSIAWANDDKTLFYTTRDAETLRSDKVWRHTLGTPQSDDVLVYHETDDTYWATVGKSKSKRFIAIASSSTLQTEVQVVEAASPHDAPRAVLAREPKHEYSVAHHKDSFYVVTNWQAKNFRLMKAPIASASKDDWTEVIPQREDVQLLGIEVFDEYLVVSERKNALRQLRVIPWDGTEEHYLAFDEPIYTARIGANRKFDTRKLRFKYSSPITPSATFDYDLKTRERKLLKQDKVLGGYVPAEYTTERVWCTARDGVKVPVSVSRRKDTPVDGSSPLYVYGYGSYGHALDPAFRLSRLALMDRGFVVGVLHVRGGEEMGRPWYEAGKLLNKKNTFSDFVDCTEHLLANDYGDPKRVVAEGGSAGGLLMGAIMNMRPDLYTAIHAAVPFVDVVTTMLDETIPLTTFEYDEWGNPNDKTFYDYILAYSPYDNVTAQAYPHVIVTTGLHDSQVQYWEPAKWVAKLRDLKTDDHLLVLETNMETGHGGSSGRYKALEDVAKVHAFFLHVLGMAP
jgi:oligopeptidase B